MASQELLSTLLLSNPNLRVFLFLSTSLRPWKLIDFWFLPWNMTWWIQLHTLLQGPGESTIKKDSPVPWDIIKQCSPLAWAEIGAFSWCDFRSSGHFWQMDKLTLYPQQLGPINWNRVLMSERLVPLCSGLVKDTSKYCDHFYMSPK